MSQDKKIYFLTHVGDPGGAEYKMIDFCRYLKSPLSVIFMQDGKLKEILSQNHIPFEQIDMPASLNGFKRDSGLLSLLKLIPDTLKMIYSLTFKLKEARAVVAMSQKSFIFACFSKIFHRRPLIWFMNDILDDSYFSQFTIKLIKFFSHYFADLVILNSEASLQAWQNKNAINKTEIIYSGIDYERLEQEIHNNQQKISELHDQFTQHNRFAVGIVGRISSWKGQHILLEAAKKVSNINIIIIGGAFFEEKSYEDELHLFIKENNLQDRVQFVGHVSNPVIYMAACDIIAHCSVTPEPFGRVLVEALIAGKPVIATNGGGAIEIVKHQQTGLLVPMSDSDALAEAISYLVENPEQAKLLAQYGKIHVENNFTLKIAVKKLETILEKF